MSNRKSGTITWGSTLLWCVLCCCFLIAQPLLRSASAESESKKKSSSSEGKKSDKKKKKEKEFEKVDENSEAIGLDSKLNGKQFEADAAQVGKVDAVIVLDASRSMLRTDPHRLRDQAAKLFLRFLSEGDRVALVQFDKEAKTLVPITDVSPTHLADLDKAIDGMVTEGGFTDLEVALEEATKILLHDGRSDATKAVVLLSDGKMDPHPSRGTPAELTTKVKETDLPQFVEKGLKLYTVSLSDESDKELLSEFAKQGGGLNWYAPDANTIHKKFSELFLTLKRPQVVPLEGGGFEVDPSVQEATFYITRKDENQEVTLIDPRGTEITSLTIPPGTKWFRGELFDVVTITHPLSGHWNVKGLETVEGFATLLSDIKLQVRFPEMSFKVGDRAAVYARLTNGGEELAKPGLEEITFYTVKVVNSETGATLVTGSLNDKGNDGDAKAGDSIFSTTLKLDKEGDYQALFAVTSPTFTRQQRISFSVAGSLISLKTIPADEFSGTREKLEVELSKSPTEYKSLKVQLILKKEGMEKAVGLVLKPSKENPQIFEVPFEKVAAGEYSVYAKLTAIDSKKKEVNGASETIQYTVVKKEGDAPGENIEEIDTAPEEAPGDDSSEMIAGILCMILALAWLGGLAFFGLKKVSSNKSHVEEKKPYVIPDALAQRIQVIKDKASDKKRKASPQDREVFSLIAGKVFSDSSDGKSEKEDAAAEETPE